ncbi:unnamed protein product [Caenorhabditis angaria]|uniref:Uncharacterized protein n=1 Tax=Caenorhabditis angaria TaxID=860376 RepID=A0A9P1IM55_9PELO|nr:unnamed protein product [Caenorhabditis angaria]
MPKNCFPLCAEKRDFMEHNPPRKAEDFFRDYDPTIGIGTAAILVLFFMVVTLKSFIRCAIRKWKMHKFYKKLEKSQRKEKDAEISATKSSEIV